MLKKVAVVALQGVAPFELGVMCEVFGIDRSEQGLPSYEFRVCAAEPPPIRTSVGFTIDTPYGLEQLADADLIGVPASPYPRADLPAELLDGLRAAVDRGAKVMSVCTGAFVLGAAGLLDGRRCTTHWYHADELARMYPTAQVDPAVLYVEDGNVFTSAGTAAGIDLCLHLVREAHGERVANGVARRMVVPPHREGGQAQYVDMPMPGSRTDTLEEVLSWMSSNLDQEMTVESLAGRALMSPRTFARRFRAETGTTPHRWLTGQRVLFAQRLLEETEETVDVVAERSGFGNAATLRHHFGRWRQTSPQAYRRMFRCPDLPCAQEAGDELRTA
jgi:transcriptional regulator GlxA family with amidase domain